MLLFVVGIGVLVPVLESRADTVYESTAIVAPVGPLDLPNLDALPKTGEVTFANGAVADSVRRALGLSASAAVVPGTVELVAGQDTLPFEIIGRSSNADDAAALANTAAATFMLEMNKFDVGSFQIQTAAEAPAKPAAALGTGPLAIVIGILAGTIAGIGAVALLLVLRRPVLDASSAEDVTGAQVMGRVAIPGGRGRVDERDVSGIAPLCRRLLASSSDLILLASPVKQASQRHKLAAAMSAVLGKIRRTRLVSGGRSVAAAPDRWSEGQPSDLRAVAEGDPRDLVLVDGPSLDHVAGRGAHSLTLLLVPEGISSRSLRNAAEEYLDGDAAGLVLVRQRRRRPSSRREERTVPEPVRVQEVRPQQRASDVHHPVDTLVREEQEPTASVRMR